MMKAARERLGLSLAVTTVPAPVAIWCNMCDVPVSKIFKVYVQQILHRERARERGRERESHQAGDSAQKVQHKQKIQAIPSHFLVRACCIQSMN